MEFDVANIKYAVPVIFTARKSSALAIRAQPFSHICACQLTRMHDGQLYNLCLKYNTIGTFNVNDILISVKFSSGVVQLWYPRCYFEALQDTYNSIVTMQHKELTERIEAIKQLQDEQAKLSTELIPVTHVRTIDEISADMPQLLNRFVVLKSRYSNTTNESTRTKQINMLRQMANELSQIDKLSIKYAEFIASLPQLADTPLLLPIQQPITSTDPFDALPQYEISDDDYINWQLLQKQKLQAEKNVANSKAIAANNARIIIIHAEELTEEVDESPV